MNKKLVQINIRKIFVVGLFWIVNFTAQGQNKGIFFENEIGWQSILAKAKAEKKYIFVDCFTTWCGPCKYMNATIFPIEKVGDFFNDKFISVSFQLDTTTRDADNIKARYADAAFIKKQYNIMAYPTFLFFSPDGNIVHRKVGGGNADELISGGQSALEPEKQYYTQVSKYEAGERDEKFLKNLTLSSMECLDAIGRPIYAKSYLSTQSNLLTNDNLYFIYQTTKSTSDTGFVLMMNNIDKFERVIDRKKLLSSLKTLIIAAEFSSDENKQTWQKSQWDNYATKLLKKYPAFGAEIFLRVKIITSRNKNDLNAYVEAVGRYASAEFAVSDELNDYAWTIFRKTNDRKILNKALKWSKQSFTDVEKIDPEYVDTYANLLYKLGKNKDALKWEMIAQKIAIEQGQDKGWGQDVIDKINRGEKTW